MDPAQSNPQVGFSRVLGLSGAVVLGGCIPLALLVFVLTDELVVLGGDDSPLILIVAAILYTPLVLLYVELSSATHGSGSLYQIAQGGRSLARTFFVGWLALAGYVSLGALLLQAVQFRLNGMLQLFFGATLSETGVTVGLLLLAAFIEYSGTGFRWRLRSALFWF